MRTKHRNALKIGIIFLTMFALSSNLGTASAQKGVALSDLPGSVQLQPVGGSIGQPDGSVNINTSTAGTEAASESAGATASANHSASSPSADANPNEVRTTSQGYPQSASDAPSALQQEFMPSSPPNADNSRSVSTTFSYFNVPASAMHPRSSATTFAYDLYGCTYQTASSDFVVADLHIPDGSLIKYIRLYYRVTSGSVSAFLTKYDGGQTTSDLVGVSSNTTAGWSFIVSSEITETVDNATYSYVVMAKPTTSGSATQFCGIRVAYYAPIITATFLPTILH